MVLQTSSQVRELNGGNWSGYSTILFRMKLVFSRIHQNSVTIYVSLIGNRFVRLTAVVESYWIGPNVLLSFANLLPVVLPMHAMPVKVVIDAVFEAGPDRGARIRCRGVDHNRARGGTTTVVNPVFVSALTLLLGPLDVVPKWAGVPNIDRAIEFFYVVFRDEGGKRFTWCGIGMNVVR